MFLEFGFFVDFFFPFLQQNHSYCVCQVKWGKERVHALPSFKNTVTSQVSHTCWIHFPFSCWHKRKSCKSCNDLQLRGTLHSLGGQNIYSPSYTIPTLSGYVARWKASSFECVSCLEIRNNHTQGNGVIQLWNWCEGRVMSTDLTGVLAAVVSKKGAGFPCYYWIYIISQDCGTVQDGINYLKTNHTQLNGQICLQPQEKYTDMFPKTPKFFFFSWIILTL